MKVDNRSCLTCAHLDKVVRRYRNGNVLIGCGDPKAGPARANKYLTCIPHSNTSYCSRWREAKAPREG